MAALGKYLDLIDSLERRWWDPGRPGTHAGPEYSSREMEEDVDRPFDVGGSIAVPSSSRTKLRQDLQIGDRRNTFDK